jgi:predicted nucleic acid-binding protein
VIADTSVWVDHFRGAPTRLPALLDEGVVQMHPFVTGELALGGLPDRATVLGWLDALPAAVAAGDDEVRWLVERHRLWGRGIGWIDAHLLASALIGSSPLLTHDRALAAVAADLGVAGEGSSCPPVGSG